MPRSAVTLANMARTREDGDLSCHPNQKELKEVMYLRITIERKMPSRLTYAPNGLSRDEE